MISILYTQDNMIQRKAFTSSGTWSVPAGVTSIMVYGRGGSGGGSKSQVVDVIPGHTYQISVGSPVVELEYETVEVSLP